MGAEPRTCAACGAEEPEGGLHLGDEGSGAEYEWFCWAKHGCIERIRLQIIAEGGTAMQRLAQETR